MYSNFTTLIFSQACADKLQREMADFGFPPEFPREAEVEEKPKEKESEIGKDKSKSKKVIICDQN